METLITIGVILLLLRILTWPESPKGKGGSRDH